ncbi:MAG: SDR family oxidoreductase [Gemmatimonadetes bacterium]|nr:SDR family oxidoreductase [Gemmatimonadota bacterium]
MMPLEGTLAVVTGASRGIGRATAEALAAAGATVARLSRSLPEGTHGPFRDLRCDLGQVADIVRGTTRILSEWGTPAVVVQNAGLFVLKPFEATDPAELDQQLALNVRAPFLVAQGLLPAMRAAGAGLHITIGSTCDHLGYPDNAAYTASKFGVRGLHEALAAEYRGTGLRFSLISPGSTDTPIWDPFDPDARPGFLRRAMMLQPEDVAEAVRFVATRPPHATVEWLRLSPTPPRE